MAELSQQAKKFNQSQEDRANLVTRSLWDNFVRGVPAATIGTVGDLYETFITDPYNEYQQENLSRLGIDPQIAQQFQTKTPLATSDDWIEFADEQGITTGTPRNALMELGMGLATGGLGAYGKLRQGLNQAGKFGQMGAVSGLTNPSNLDDYQTRMNRAREMGFDTDAYSGSTHDIRKFDASISNPRNDWGRGIYASSSAEDVAENYATPSGADITQRIEGRAEELADQYSMDDYGLEDELAEIGLTMDDYVADESAVMNALAKKELIGSASEGVTYPLKLNTKDFAVINNGDSTILYEDDYYELAKSYLDEADYDDLDDFEDDVLQKMNELRLEDEDSLYNRVHDALRRSDIWEDEMSINNVMQAIQDDILEGQLNLGDLDNAIRQEILIPYDEAGEMLSQGEISSQVLKNLGYKGVIDKTVNRKFGTQREYGVRMGGMDEDTIHYIIFPESENLIRSPNAVFDPKKKESLDILSSLNALGAYA